MSSIDNALMRIQEIATRIRQIQGLALRPPDLPPQLSSGPAASGATAASGTPAGAAATPGEAPAAAAAGGASRSAASVNPAQFQKLLDALLAAQSGTSGAGAGGLASGAGLSTGAAGLDALGLGGLGLGSGGGSGGGGSTDLASLGLPTDLASLLSTGAPSPPASPGQAANAARLQSYQQELRSAVRNLIAASKAGTNGPVQ